MVLAEWVRSNFHKISRKLEIKDSDMLHVVGVCGSCRHFNYHPGEEHTVWCETYKSDQTCTEWEGSVSEH